MYVKWCTIISQTSGQYCIRITSLVVKTSELDNFWPLCSIKRCLYYLEAIEVTSVPFIRSFIGCLTKTSMQLLVKFPRPYWLIPFVVMQGILKRR